MTSWAIFHKALRSEFMEAVKWRSHEQDAICWGVDVSLISVFAHERVEEVFLYTAFCNVEPKLSVSTDGAWRKADVS